MTLAISLVTKDGAWSSVDHRLTNLADGRLRSDSSVKHVRLQCPDGLALISYTGLGLIGSVDLSQWVREISRGEVGTVGESLGDLQTQATRTLGPQAFRLGVQHVFLVCAFVGGRAWAFEIRNFQPETPAAAAALLSEFETVGRRVDEPILLVGGAGRDAIGAVDRDLLLGVSGRRPRKPQEYMQLLADVNRRAAKSKNPGARTISSSCTVAYASATGDGDDLRHYTAGGNLGGSPGGLSQVLFGIDLAELVRPEVAMFEAWRAGRITANEFTRAPFDSHAIKPKGRRGP